MDKVRVYQLAKELKVQSALILELLDRLGREVRSDLSMLDPGTAELVRDRVTVALQTERQRLDEERAAALAQTAEAPAAAEPFAPAASGTSIAAGPAARAVAATTRPATPPRAASKEPGATTETPAAPLRPSGAPKPRVFPARRIPSAAALAKAKIARTGRLAPTPAIPGRPGGPIPPGVPARPGAPARPGGRVAPPPGAGPKKRRKRDRGKVPAQPPTARPKPDLPPVPEKVTLSEGVTVKELAEKLNRKSKDVIAKLLTRGVLATINQPLNPETAIEVAREFGSKATVISFEEEAQAATSSPTLAVEDGADEPAEPANLEPRPPVVTVMGHVDHGKTSLLDALRASHVVEHEAGGITQHIGAYQVETQGRKITFLDTPGHEAFTLMRARGAKATDIVVLVVAADDGVKPQTLEAIDHSKAAGVPLVVAINKIDKPNANPDRVKQQLMERDLVIEDYGGDIVCCEVSAKQKSGLDHLLEMLLLVADLKELKADPNRPATGIVLEARLDRARGVLATMLVQNGTLETGSVFIAGTAYGKVRAMTDEHGTKITSAGPSTPVEVMGFADQPKAGDKFQAIADEAKARQIASFRSNKQREERLKSNVAMSLEAFSQQAAGGSVKELRLLLKGDAHGSLEALQKGLAGLPSDKIRVNVLRTSIGAITQADVLLASASNALVVGFNVRPNAAAAELAKKEGVELRMYTVIYQLLEEIEQAMVGMLDPTLKENVLGQATVRQPFKIPKIGTIAGSYVTDGKVTRKAEIRLLRDNVVILTGKVSSLRRFKDDVAEVKQGYECGIGIANYDDIKEGDVIEFFMIEQIAAKSL